jgi:PmbA protein
MTDYTDFVSYLIDTAKKEGAEIVEVINVAASSISAQTRLGKLEHYESSESLGFGLRVIIGNKQSIVSSSDYNLASVNPLIKRAVDMAQVALADPFLTVSTTEQYVNSCPDLEIFDASEPSKEWLIDTALATEQAALDQENVTNSEGASASHSHSEKIFATSNGFFKSYQSSYNNISMSAVAGKDADMQTDYYYSSARFVKDLEKPNFIGAQAGRLTAAKLYPKKLATSKMPVIFDPRVAQSLLANFANSINGASIARGTSFLKDGLHQQIFNKNINIVDDPHISKGLSSRPFDGEGVAGRKLTLVKDGVLQSWVLDLRSAKQLSMVTTGHAARGLSSPPHPSVSNLYIEKGSCSKEDLMQDIKEGLYVTDLFGMGINPITGDYSQGASGFKIENGAITYPVSEITIADNLRVMFQKIIAANDLVFKYGINSPTLRVDNMTIAGT